jgi:hypothetical protein
LNVIKKGGATKNSTRFFIKKKRRKSTKNMPPRDPSPTLSKASQSFAHIFPHGRKKIEDVPQTEGPFLLLS